MNFKNYIKESSISSAFFISPKGELITSDSNHIKTVIDNPSKFGLSINYIKDVYKKHNEKLGIEGDAREEILLKLMNQGWIRLRRYPNRFWSIQTYDVNNRIKSLISDWAKKIINGIKGFKELDKYIEVKITSFKSNRIIKYTVNDLTLDMLKYEKIENSELIIKNIDELEDLNII